MRIGSLFSGAGGLDMAVEEVFGGEVIWHAEIDKAASKVLAHRFPDVPNLGDITEVDWSNWQPVLAVDVLCGGFPCQDVSAAGKRAGIKDGTRSGLWAIFADAIDALRPRYVVIENVRGLLSAQAHRAVESDDAVVGDGSDRPVLRALGAVLGDLADLGYDAQWTTIAAADVGAPHRRDRVFILASNSSGVEWLPRTAITRQSADRGAPGASGRHCPVTEVGSGTDWGHYEPSIIRWELLTSPVPNPTVMGNSGNSLLNPQLSEWLMGWPAGWVTDPAIGISRNEQLKIVGNGVCPQQAVAALRFLLSVSEVAA